MQGTSEDDGFFTSRVYGIILLVWIIIVTIFLILLLCIYIAHVKRTKHREEKYRHNGTKPYNAYSTTNGTLKSSLKSTEMNNINHTSSTGNGGTTTGPVGVMVRNNSGRSLADPEWIGSMKEDLVADYSIETISDSRSNVYSAYSPTTPTSPTSPTYSHYPPSSSNTGTNKYARVKRQHMNGDMRPGLHGYQNSSYS